MRRNVSRSLVTLVLAVALSLALLPTSLMAEDDDPNTIESSSMWFVGELTDNGDGSYSGTIAMVNESDETLGDEEAGFDVYAKEGAKATYDKEGSGTEDYACGAVAYHDAYNTAGGWGSFWDPDCADWEHYQLRFEDDNWYLEYNGGSFGTQIASPMSGTMDWTAMYAAETDAGDYYPGEGPAENDGYALNNSCTGTTGTNDGSAAWDMDWSWGSEYIPLQFPGFDVTRWAIEGEGNYRVRLQPAAAGATQLTAEVEDIVAISVDPTSIDFGSLVPGQTSGVHDIAVTNVGTNQVDVDADVGGSSGELFHDNLELKNHTESGTWSGGPAWSGIITGLNLDASETLRTQLPVPSGYTPSGEETAALTFTATAS